MSDKIRYDIENILNEMREEYWTGVTEAEEEQQGEKEHLTFALGGEVYAFPSHLASGVIRLPKLIRLPRVQKAIAGVFNLRGVITAALDVRPVLDLPSVPLTAAARVIVMKGEHAQTGIIVEAVQGVEPLPDVVEPVVKTLSPQQREYITGQIQAEGQLVLLLDVGKLLAAPALAVNHG